MGWLQLVPNKTDARSLPFNARSIPRGVHGSAMQVFSLVATVCRKALPGLPYRRIDNLQPFRTVLERLRAHYGAPRKPLASDPFEIVLLENVAYLVSESQREAAFRALRKRVGTTADAILAAPREVLYEIAELGGLYPESRVDKILECARIVKEQCGGDLNAVLKEPPARVRKILKQFPGITDPGADKILLFSGTSPIFTVESNGLRAVTRMGYGSEQKSYAATYRSAQDAVRNDLPRDCEYLIGVFALLRQHGQTLCKRTAPLCRSCPAADNCAYARAGLAS